MSKRHRHSKTVEWQTHPRIEQIYWLLGGNLNDNIYVVNISYSNHVIFQILKHCLFHLWLWSIRFTNDSAQKPVSVKVHHTLSTPHPSTHMINWLIIANPFVNRRHRINFDLIRSYFTKQVIAWSLMTAPRLQFVQGTLPEGRPYSWKLPPIKADEEWKALQNFGGLRPQARRETFWVSP
jgi:hypothetical protein